MITTFQSTVIYSVDRKAIYYLNIICIVDNLFYLQSIFWSIFKRRNTVTAHCVHAAVHSPSL